MAIFTFNTRNITLFISCFLIFLSFPTLCLSSSIHDLLRSKGLRPGLLPKEVKSYSHSENGMSRSFLKCLAKYENRVYFESVVKANLNYGSLNGVVGLSQEELFLWLSSFRHLEILI
ncbi:hypothetical protein Patl1_16506 [Pistacia atlantica]|uniref:Uncharacterized protein n=1 Tax=Pistacia atlantica TaxID=434234 RepID=A0ACC1B9Z8_9ROSI|nr:hypothetical protein Patl1_16506 [Pistacia atlantica]